MVNVAKYLLLLESLKFNDEDESQKAECRLEQNVKLLRAFLKHTPQEALKLITTELNVQNFEAEIEEVPIKNDDFQAEYSIYMQHVLLEIVSNCSFASDAREDLISTRHTNLCIEAVQDLAEIALGQQLHSVFYQSRAFSKNVGKERGKSANNYTLLNLTIEGFAKFLQIKQFHIANSMQVVIRDYMASIFTLFLANALKEWTMSEVTSKHLQFKLDAIWLKVSKMEYFRNIMLLKGIPQLPMTLQQQLHKELLQKLLSKDGFTTFVATMYTAQNRSAVKQDNEIEINEIIAQIVAFPGHTACAQHILITQIFKFFDLCLLNESMMQSMGAGLLALRRLYHLNENNKVCIKNLLKTSIQKLHRPEDILTSLIIMEHNEFTLWISMWYHLFCTSTVECLPSEILVNYLPMLLQIYYNMPDGLMHKQQISSLIIRCLNNRTVPELQDIIKKLYTQIFDAAWVQLHARLLIVPNAQQSEIMFKIASHEYKPDFSISQALPELLMSEQHHMLTYRLFMMLLKMMFAILDDGEPSTEEPIDLLQTEEELLAFLNSKYPVKVEILLSLNTLISHPPLKSQISENTNEFLKFLRSSIEKRVNDMAATTTTNRIEYTDQTLLIMLTLAQELLEHSEMPETFRNFMPTLKKLQCQTSNQLIQQRISTMMTLLSGNFKATAAQNATAFANARLLLESPESHLQVYGIQMLVDLLRRKDVIALSNTHIIIALALSTLKNKESYTFLNCVRLFVALVHVIEAEVLDVLTDEYLNDNAQMDFRLVVGEAVLKVSKELGPLCYKHKQVLLNCFMAGARSKLNEFRMSSYVNLAQMTRILSYQVHSFFQELLNLIDCELTTGQYLPAKRAAVLVLGELLEGMDNLMDFEEMLLPIYRLLRLLESSENCDDKMRIHAANGLKVLAQKCKKLLFPEQQMQKEIQILGMNENKKRSLKHHILKMN